ncbi:protein ALP1-like [Harpegnathos saltator]|uniref:protein ALP1-like n=1 Tax=Harpegnathos saltator TaxID=610380 RepID=UPI000DBEE272|nr:protein ALP1-like [Harpegnathos saltator]
MIQCPNNAGSLYFNYKHWNSIVLLGICNAEYIFTFVDIGAYGRRSDGGIFKDSVIGNLFEKKKINLPESESISPGGKFLSYILVGDEAFQLAEYLLRPYPGKYLNIERRIFNYRFSHARRTIENTFGILVSRWRILKRSIICSVEKTIKIVQAIVCLHNWLRIADIDENQYVPPSMVDQYTSDGEVPGSWRNFTEGSALHDIGKFGSNNSSRRAQGIRDEFFNYFYGEGAIPWQFDCL